MDVRIHAMYACKHLHIHLSYSKTIKSSLKLFSGTRCQKDSCQNWQMMKMNRRQFFHLLDGADPGRGMGWGGGWRGGRAPVRKDWFLPSTHMHPPLLPICPTLSLTKRHCHICSICFYATSTSCIRYNLSVGLKKRNEPEMSNLNSLALQDGMN